MTQDQITRMLESTSEQDMRNLLNYLNIQKAENEAVRKGTNAKEMVQIYLDELSKYDELLASKYPKNPAGKTIEDCMEYVQNNARKCREGSSSFVAVTSFAVFNWAVEYFLDDSIAIVKKKKTIPAKKQDKTPTIEELQKEKAEWQAMNDKLVQEWEVNHNAQIDAFELKNKLELFPAENPYLKDVNPYLGKTFPNQELLDKLLTGQSSDTSDNEDIEETDSENEDEENIGEIE